MTKRRYTEERNDNEWNRKLFRKNTKDNTLAGLSVTLLNYTNVQIFYV